MLTVGVRSSNKQKDTAYSQILTTI